MEIKEINSPIPTPLLITGLPGVPGYNAFFYYQKVLQKPVWGIKPSHQKNLIGPHILTVDAEQPEKLKPIFEKMEIKAVLDASGCCALRSCEHNPEMAQIVNVDFGEAIAKEAQSAGARLIRLSSDMVFAGRPEGLYLEADPLSPLTVYGKTMAKSEEKILGACPGALILRIPLPMAPSLSGHAGAIDWIRHRFHHHRPATLYFDEIRSPFYNQDLIHTISLLFSTDHAGIFHFGGTRTLSLFQIAQIINKLGGYPPDLLKGCLRKEAGPMPPRIGDVSLDCSKLRAILPEAMMKPWPLLDEHVPDSREWHYERDSKARFSIEENLYGYGGMDSEEHPASYLPGLGFPVGK